MNCPTSSNLVQPRPTSKMAVSVTRSASCPTSSNLPRAHTYAYARTYTSIERLDKVGRLDSTLKKLVKKHVQPRPTSSNLCHRSKTRSSKDSREGGRPRQLEASRRALRRASSTETLPADPERADWRPINCLSRRPFALFVLISAILSMWLARFLTNSGFTQMPNNASNWPLILALPALRGTHLWTLEVSAIASWVVLFLVLIAAGRLPN